MSPDELIKRLPLSELNFSASRSGGPGGQNVNKVSTKIELRFNVRNSASLTETEKDRIFLVLKNKINTEGEILIISQSERTQLLNRKKAVEKFFRLVASALTEKPARKSTSPTKSSIAKRLESKKKKGEIKRLRRDSAPDTE